MLGLVPRIVQKRKTHRDERDGWRSTRRKVDLIAVYAVGTYFQTIVKRVGAILTGHSDALTDSPKTKVATNHDRVIVVVVEIRRSFSFLTKIERFDSIERDEDCYKKTKRRKKMGLSKRKKDEGRRERERIKTENGDEITQLHAPRDKYRCTK